MKLVTKFQLSLMMFLNFFIRGAWFVTLGTYLSMNLNATGADSAKIFSTQSWGAIIAPFIVGLIADRYFNAEKILAVSHMIGGFLLLKMYNAPDITSFYPFVLGYMILFMPTMALVNSISFRQMDNPKSQFPPIRVWGTIGYIVAGLMISFVFHWDNKENLANGLLRYTFILAATGSLILGLFSFSLPKTPPIKAKNKKSSVKEILGLDALKLLKDKSLLVYFISAILICIPMGFYFQYAHPFLSEKQLKNPTGMMSIGQVSETVFILLIPLFLKYLGLKKTILIGILAWTVRYLLFAYGNADSLAFMYIIAIALHGVCYDFFFVVGQIFTDQKAGVRYKSSAQGLLTLATYGIGMFMGFEIAGFIADNYKTIAGTRDWQTIWMAPAIIALVVGVLFVSFFREKNKIHH